MLVTDGYLETDSYRREVGKVGVDGLVLCADGSAVQVLRIVLSAPTDTDVRLN